MSKQRRTYTAQFKLETVLEALRGEKSVVQLCRERGIKDSLYYKWRDQFFEQAGHIFTEKAARPHDEQGQQIAELERMVGRLAMENEILKKASNILERTRRGNGT